MNQNPQYQQQPQQPEQQYQQQPQYYQRPKGAFSHGVVEFCSKAAAILAFVFLCMAGAAVLYYLIDGIVVAAQTRSFQQFLNIFVSGGLAAAARYCFYAAVLTLLKKIAK
ncbi:MAG: hypothetical protein J5925_07090 [Clostridia bacterium]|nr:hypothetical protein [Clostridia bacterium]MBR4799473.1 hypothetical protein [Clostridia bacterium]MBR5746089.1 hypothetical protein [Clostridia bacterium]